MSDTTALEVLGRVLASARETLGMSPEHAGRAAAIAGNTIRRLERAAIRRPRAVTLERLAEFYGLNAPLLRELAESGELHGEELLGLLRAHAPDREDDAPESEPDLVGLARRLAHAPRRSTSADGLGAGRSHLLALALRHLDGHLQPGEETDVVPLVIGLAHLSRRRRRLVREIVDEMLRAQAQPASEVPMLRLLGDRAQRLYDAPALSSMVDNELEAAGGRPLRATYRGQAAPPDDEG